MENHQPLVLSCSQISSDFGTRVSCSTTAIPVGQRFVVEHISGVFTAGTGVAVDQIWATDGFGQDVYLPTHFESRDLNFGGSVGRARNIQFGSPVRMYIEAGRSITINGDANMAVEISATVIGYLVSQ